MQRWRAVFAKELHAATGRWVHDRIEWHVFSYGHHPSETGDVARNVYRSVARCVFVVLGADQRTPFGFRCEGKPPERLKAGVDLIVAPESMAWTMVFTHEEPVLGPYFAVP